MSSILLREFVCDHMFGQTIRCSESLVVKTNSCAYGTNDSKEREQVEEAGWKFGDALKVYCPEHSPSRLSEERA